MIEKQETDTDLLIDAVVESLQEKKANEIVRIDLQNIETAVCKYFVICTGTSNIHVSALADFAEDNVKEKTGQKVWRKEGMENAQWVLLDYADVVVHIFQKEYRDFYQLESLWADAPLLKMNDLEQKK